MVSEIFKNINSDKFSWEGAFWGTLINLQILNKKIIMFTEIFENINTAKSI